MRANPHEVFDASYSTRERTGFSLRIVREVGRRAHGIGPGHGGRRGARFEVTGVGAGWETVR